MVNSFIINICIMVALAALSFHTYRNAIKVIEQHPIATKIMIGIIGGFTGFLLMINTITVGPTVIIDFRNVIVILCAVFGGPIAAFLSAIIMGILRFSIMDLLQSTIAVLVELLCIAIGSSIISMRSASFRWKWIAGFFLNIVVSTAVLTVILMKSPGPDLSKVLFYYFAGSLIMTVVLYVIIEYYLDFANHYERLTGESTKDSLTGLNNVRAFDSELNKAIDRCSRTGEQLAFLALDIDFFKKVNDNYGHVAGDEVLKGLANLLVETCRVFDILSRNGGEEFTVILQDCPSQYAMVVAERIRKAVEETEFKVNNNTVIHITISIGIAAYPDSTDNPDNLREYADRALYNAKESGRNKVVIYNNLNFIWRKDWESGNLTIDHQHKKLNELADRIVKQTLKGADIMDLLPLLEEVQQNIVEHFEYEEKCLFEMGYPKREDHADIHKDLVSSYVNLKESYLTGIIKPSAFYSFIIEDVILGHLKNEDVKFFSYFRNS